MTAFTALPAKARAAIYWANFVLGLLLGSAQVWFLVTVGAQPTWLTGMLAVGAFLSAGFGLTAASNTVLRPVQPVTETDPAPLN